MPDEYKPASRPESAPPLPEGVLSVLELEMEVSELRETIADLHERLDDRRREAEANAEDQAGELILARESLSKMAEASAEVIDAYRRMFGDSHLEPLGHDAGNLFRAIRELENITD
jgi:predicted ribosome quality control (RQC) complex YloA/Tae2 family protein